MSERVLFVDDDQMLLSSMRRCLGERFDVETALSGAEALRMIQCGESFAVIVTDMRMPVMDGIEFIRRAREIAPHAIYLMLTGNQDLTTAARAVNEGAVAYFLNKPCDLDEIAWAVEASLRRYAAEDGSRRVVGETLDGALAIADGLVERRCPALLGLAERLAVLTTRLGEAVGSTAPADLRLASRLVPAGVALASDGDADRFLAAQPGDSDFNEPLTPALGEIAELFSGLNRLHGAIEILRCASVPMNGVLSAADEADATDTVRSAAVLRVALVVDRLRESDASVGDASDAVRSLLAGAGDRLVEAAIDAFRDEECEAGVEVPPADLAAGMVLSRDLCSPDGQRLMSAGRPLSQKHVERLRGGEDSLAAIGTVGVTAASYEALAEAIA